MGGADSPRLARRRGIDDLVGEVLPENLAMLRLYRDFGFRTQSHSLSHAALAVELSLGFEHGAERVSTRRLQLAGTACQPVLHCVTYG